MKYDTIEQHDPMPLVEVLEKVREGCEMHMNQLDNDGYCAESDEYVVALAFFEDYIEKITKEFVRDIYLIIETPQSKSLKLSVTKNNEGNKIIKEDAAYLVQDAKQQILKTNQDLRILHIIVENYVLDNVQYKFLPLNQKCNKFSIDVKFICFPKKLLKNFEKLFSKQQIFINQFICLNYIKTPCQLLAKKQ